MCRSFVFIYRFFRAGGYSSILRFLMLLGSLLRFAYGLMVLLTCSVQLGSAKEELREVCDQVGALLGGLSKGCNYDVRVYRYHD